MLLRVSLELATCSKLTIVLLDLAVKSQYTVTYNVPVIKNLFLVAKGVQRYFLNVSDVMHGMIKILHIRFGFHKVHIGLIIRKQRNDDT